MSHANLIYDLLSLQQNTNEVLKNQPHSVAVQSVHARNVSLKILYFLGSEILIKRVDNIHKQIFIHNLSDETLCLLPNISQGMQPHTGKVTVYKFVNMKLFLNAFCMSPCWRIILTTR